VISTSPPHKFPASLFFELLSQTSFPYPSTRERQLLASNLWRFVHTTSNLTYTLGYITPPVAAALLYLPSNLSTHLLVDINNHTISLTAPTQTSRSASLAIISSYLRGQNSFKILTSWRNEQYPIYSPPQILYATIERSAAPLFGVLAYCVYLIATTHIKVEGKKELRIWTPRRSKNKQTWPGMLDATVAGAMSVGEGAWDCVIREAEEEASLGPAMVKDQARECGQVTYFGMSDGKPEHGGGEEGLMQPECGFVFELELDEGVTPTPRDGEVEEFYCWGVEEVKEALIRGEYKTNSAGVMLDWLARHGQLDDQVDGYDEIQRRMRRSLDFPLM